MNDTTKNIQENKIEDDNLYNEYYIKDIKSKIRKYIEIGDDKFIKALKSLLRSDDEDNKR